MKKLILISALLFSFNGWSDDHLPESIGDPFGKLIEFKSQCEIAEKGEPERWQKEINKPIDDSIK